MKTLNRVILIGRIGATPSLQTSKLGQPYIRLSIATDRKTRSDQPRQPDWHPVFVWGQLAEKILPFLQKGDLVLVEGEIRNGPINEVGRTLTLIKADTLRRLSRPSSPPNTAPEEDPS